MKKLEDFECEKVEIGSIYGGRIAGTCLSGPNSCTIGPNGSGCEDGPWELDD
jgi:hypothetical protein